MRYAHEQMNGEKLWEYSGGQPTNKFLEKFEFPIIPKNNDPVAELIKKYKSHLREFGLTGEKYKWELLSQFKGRPDVSAVDFYQEIRATKFSNLIYPVGVSVIHHIARERTEPYRECFKILFDENKPLIERLNYFDEQTLKIYRELVPKEAGSHHQDERTMATFLTFHNPDIYTFYKDSFYQNYCRLIGVNSRKTGEKFVHYLELVTDLINEYILEDKELLDLINNLLTSDCFQDSNHKILAQDILFQTLDRQIGSNRNYWRVGTSDNNGNSYWESMKSNKVISIGWSEIGDLYENNVKNKKEIEVFLKDKDYFKDDNRQRSRKAGEIYDFYSNIKLGDVVLAQDGAKILGIGIIKDDYKYSQKDDFAHQKDVEWKIFDPPISNSQGLRTTVFQVTDLTTINKIDELLRESNLNKISNKITMNNSLNQILFGPPGTGKTYNTINKALLIIDEKEEKDLDWSDREAVKNLFDKRVEQGRIIFTTFHQSMSYEDFIEGLKPIEPDEEGQPVIYRVEPGIFKKICQSAQTPNQLDFSTSFKLLIKDLKSVEYIPLKTPTGKEFHISLNTNGNLNLHTGTSKTKQGSLTKDNIQKQINGEDKYTGWEGYFQGVIDYLVSKYNYSLESSVNQKFVLIIDEINRGNISQIFGELITLIEEDKRLGKDEYLEATLTYSKEKFGVPSNLYIIGTMNTADRSVEAMDTALRRRFSFQELTPQYNLKELDYEIFGFKAYNILEAINSRIEKLLDKDHLIGHSYFIVKSGKNTDEHIIQSFYENIIPLLQEYFYGDFGKIGLVLGKGFVSKKLWDNELNSFAEFQHESYTEFEDRPVFEIIDYREKNLNHSIQLNSSEGNKVIEMNFELALKLLMKQKIG
jgi:5-methylcytosine-specific restriction protein B